MEETSRKTSSLRSTEMAKEVGALSRLWYRRAAEVKEKGGGKIGWEMFGVPHEVLLAMDVQFMGTEHYSAVCGVKQVAQTFADKSAAEGYCRDICGYVRVGLGLAARYKELGGPLPEAPYGGIPLPDMLFARTHCEAGYKWYQALQRYLQVPTFVWDDLLPWPDTGFYLDDEQVARQYITYYKEMLNDLVQFLELHTRKKLDLDRLREIIRISQESQRLWFELNKIRRRSIPCPIPTQDFMACVFPFLSMQGTPEALDFFRRLHAEVK